MSSFRIVAVAVSVFLSACSGLHQERTNTSFRTFQTELIAQRDAGNISPLQAQLDLWSKYREIFGEDATMNGFYSFSVKLMSAVEAGKIPLEEAQMLIDERENEISSRKSAEAARRLAYDPYGNPSD